ncbi:unnamed protein product, partial [Discosporangium mesarthrocarpum]
VYFHRTLPGGCCDCGDEEAWAQEGCCSRHRRKTSRGGGERKDIDPAESLPDAIQVR